MTQYIKPTEEFKNNDNVMVVQPLTHEGTERFSLFDTKEKKFYNEGDMIHVEGRVDEEECTRYIKLTDDEKKRYRRVMKIRRDVLYNGEEWVYDMPLSVDKELIKTMQTVESMDKNPLSFNYKIVRNVTGSNAWDVEYQVMVGEEVTGVPEVESEIEEPDITLEDEEEDAVELTSSELKYVEAIKKKYPDYAEKGVDVWSSLLKNKLSIDASRARKISEQYLS